MTLENKQVNEEIRPKERRSPDIILNRISRVVRILLAFTFFLAVMVSIISYQTSSGNESKEKAIVAAQKAEVASNKAQAAAEGTSQSLQDALKLVQTATNSAQTVETRERIKRMEFVICGGHCPAVSTTTTTVKAK